jgi:hypothetical protein
MLRVNQDIPLNTKTSILKFLGYNSLYNFKLDYSKLLACNIEDDAYYRIYKYRSYNIYIQDVVNRQPKDDLILNETKAPRIETRFVSSAKEKLLELFTSTKYYRKKLTAINIIYGKCTIFYKNIGDNYDTGFLYPACGLVIKNPFNTNSQLIKYLQLTYKFNESIDPDILEFWVDSRFKERSKSIITPLKAIVNKLIIPAIEEMDIPIVYKDNMVDLFYEKSKLNLKSSNITQYQQNIKTMLQKCL